MRLEIERHGLRKPDAVEGTYNNFTRGRDGFALPWGYPKSMEDHKCRQPKRYAFTYLGKKLAKLAKNKGCNHPALMHSWYRYPPHWILETLTRLGKKTDWSLAKCDCHSSQRNSFLSKV
eukprot:scaffold1997_cov318-Pavlova_lutheri.AAC.10